MKVPIQRLSINFALVVGFALAGPSRGFAGTHFTLQGSASQSNLGLNTQSDYDASISIAEDVGPYLRLGVTHRQKHKETSGYNVDPISQSYQFTQEMADDIANSVDLSVILYYGSVFVPYVQVGLVRKDYFLSSKVELGEPVQTKYVLGPVWNAGIGMGIRLNQYFSLNLAYNVSPGYKQEKPGMPPKSALDSYASIGITYNL